MTEYENACRNLLRRSGIPKIGRRQTPDAKMGNIKHYTTAQAAKMIGRCSRQVQRYCEQGLLGQKIGRNWAITDAELKEFVTTRKATT